jgi:hypothetical protein
MINNFDDVKKQLGELSDVVNKFKSEAVQLKILEWIFKGSFGGVVESDKDANAPPKQQRKSRKGRKSLAATANGSASTKKALKPKGTGPGGTLDLLIEKGFFAEPKTLREIIDYAKNSLARTIKQGDMSGPLARTVRDGKLTRSKNAEGQYAYRK